MAAKIKIFALHKEMYSEHFQRKNKIVGSLITATYKSEISPTVTCTVCTLHTCTSVLFPHGFLVKSFMLHSTCVMTKCN